MLYPVEWKGSAARKAQSAQKHQDVPAIHAMRIDCHTHTARYSQCSGIPPDELCRIAREQGLDAVALTDHHRFWPDDELDALRLKHPALTIYAGVEVSLREGYDLVCLSKSRSLGNLRFPRFAEFMAQVTPYRSEIFLFVAHPFRYEQDLTPALCAILAVVDGIEVNSVNILRHNARRTDHPIRPSDEETYAAARAAYGLIPVFNSDAHAAVAVGTIATTLPADCPPAGEAALAALLKQGRTNEWQDTERLARCLDIIEGGDTRA